MNEKLNDFCNPRLMQRMGSVVLLVSTDLVIPYSLSRLIDPDTLFLVMIFSEKLEIAFQFTLSTTLLSRVNSSCCKIMQTKGM